MATGEGGDVFNVVEAVVDGGGLTVAADLAEHLLPGGASHYVGAAVAELPVLLFETLVLDRRVHWTHR